jgi:hypothetical protein
MSGPGFEHWLAIGLVAVYWLDSLRFLKPRDVAIDVLGRRAWRVRFGMVGFDLAGLRPAALAFFRPDRPVLVTRWSLARSEPDEEFATTLRENDVWLDRGARWLGGLCLTAFVLVVIASPIALLLGHGVVFLGLFIASYLVAVAGGVLLSARAPKYGMTRSAAFRLALIAVVCLPCSPNLLRAASAAAPFRKIVLPDFARDGTDDTGWVDFKRRFERALAAEIRCREPQSTEARMAKAMLERIRRPQGTAEPGSSVPVEPRDRPRHIGRRDDASPLRDE